MFSLVLVSGLYVALSALFYKNVSQGFFSFGISLGAALSALVVFAVPTVILGALSPYLIKLACDAGSGIGTSSGRLYATSTIGSLLGTFLTALVLIPRLGIRETFFLNSLIIIFLALMWLWRTKRWAALFLLFPILISGVPAESRADNVLASAESAYSSLDVVDYGDTIGLRTDERNGTIYSFVPRKGNWKYGSRLYDLFSLAPILANAKRALLLGVGAGTIPMLHEEMNPSLDITGVEIDPTIIDLGRKYFRLKEADNISRLAIEDARPFLLKEESLYDLIEVDLFWGGAEIPFYLATQEFFDLTGKHLAPGGLLAMNIYDPSEDRILVSPLINTIAASYPHTYVVPAGFGSYFVLAGERPIDLAPLLPLRAEQSPRGDLVRHLASSIQTVSYSEKIQTFTDNLNSLEILNHEAQR